VIMNIVKSHSQVDSRPAPAPRGDRLRRWLGRGLLVFVLLGAAGAVYQSLATARDARNFPPPGQVVDVDGRQMHINCMGQGSPTVILEQGGGGNALFWFLVQPEVARSTRVCAYDRAGMGWSDPGPDPRNGQQIANELHTLLHNANIPGPYVLAGWSYGGLFVRSYAMQYPEEVAGLALLDASHPEQWTRTAQGQATYQNDSRNYTATRFLARLGLLRLFPLPFTTPPAGLSPQLVAQFKAVMNTTKLWDTTEAESRFILDTMAQVRQAGHLGDLPLMVVTAGENPGADGQWAVYQDELAELSTNSVHLILEGAQHHSLVLDTEDSLASSSAILRVVAAVRAGAPLNP
jgi:pimeloyl-ACP methyl ester carboxylesterase